MENYIKRSLFGEKFQSNPKYQPQGDAQGKVQESPNSLGFMIWEL